MRLFKDFTGIGHRLTAANSSDSRHPRRRRCALGLEQLEDRVALSTFLVTTTGDQLNPDGSPVNGSLRWTIVQSNRTPGPNEIDFTPGLRGTIALTNGQLTIMDDDVKIVGAGADRLIVSGNNASRVFEIDLVHTAISGLTINGGNTFSHGGGIDNESGTVTFVACTISGNSADFGGGLTNRGTMTITACTISGNRGESVSAVSTTKAAR